MMNEEPLCPQVPDPLHLGGIHPRLLVASYTSMIGKFSVHAWCWRGGRNEEYSKSLYRTRMANSALKCRIIILITAMSFCSYNNILIIIRHP